MRLHDLASTYDVLLTLEMTFLLVVLLRFLWVLRLNRYFNVLYFTLMGSFRLLVPYIIFLLCVLSCCAVITQNLWGIFNERYRSFAGAFLASAQALTGAPEIEFWLRKGSDWSIVYFIVYYFCVALLLPRVCIGIFMESYRIAILKIGNPGEEKETWGISKYLGWLFQCCPTCFKNKLGLIEEESDDANGSRRN
eukprot:TRINITY_DN4292_c0_g2_i1.p1 TRINITY_DN4292_c0_g2~~TRINITY_DN4292_c0_g2_i1.p1  ORF type:complete len:194 (+),score=10.19 TRINITY_DN4292_c0_g2_i1:579-1160(+)